MAKCQVRWLKIVLDVTVSISNALLLLLTRRRRRWAARHACMPSFLPSLSSSLCLISDHFNFLSHNIITKNTCSVWRSLNQILKHIKLYCITRPTPFVLQTWIIPQIVQFVGEMCVLTYVVLLLIDFRCHFLIKCFDFWCFLSDLADMSHS